MIDFSQFVNNQRGYFEAPVQVGDIISADVTVTGTPFNETDGAYLWNSPWGLLANGEWDSGRNGFAGYVWGDQTGMLRFAFNDSPVSAVGAFINDAPGYGDFYISVYDADMNMLEQYDIWKIAPISTPDMINGGAFRGIVLETSLISYFEITGYVPVVDDLVFTRTPIPEPATMLLLGTGLLGLVGIGRKKFFKD